MKRLSLLPISAFVFFLISESQAQETYPGYVVTTKNDTIKGNILEGQWMKSPRKITLQISGEKQEVYDVEGLKAFSANDIIFEGYRVDIPVNSNAKFGGDTEAQKARVFLEVLARGKKLSLLRYYDGRKTSFYIQSPKDSVPALLVYSKTEVNGYIRPNEKYKNQLTTLAIENGTTEQSLLDRIKNVNYQHKDLVKIVNLMNGQTETSQSADRRNSYRIFVGAGSSIPSFSYETYDQSNSYLSNKQSNSSAPSLYFNLGGDYHFGRVFVRLEASYNHNSVTHSSLVNYSIGFNQSLKQNVFGISLKLNYDLILRKKARYYLGMGMKSNFISTPVNTSDYFSPPEMKDFLINIPISAGVVINQRADIIFTFIPKHHVTPSYQNLSGSMSYFQVGVNYFFIRSK